MSQEDFREKDRKSHRNFEHQVICEKPDDSTQYMGKSCNNLFFWNNQGTYTDLEDHVRLTRRLLTNFCCLHPNSPIKRLHLPQKGEWGLVNIHRLGRTQDINMGNKLRSTKKCLMRLADKGYTSLKLNVQNTDDDITYQKKSWTPGERKPYMANSRTLCRKIMWMKIPPHCGFLQTVSVLGQKVLHSPSKTGWSKPGLMRGTSSDCKW